MHLQDARSHAAAWCALVPRAVGVGAAVGARADDARPSPTWTIGIRLTFVAAPERLTVDCWDARRARIIAPAIHVVAAFRPAECVTACSDCC